MDHHKAHHYSNRIPLGMRLKDWRGNRKIAEVASMLGVSISSWGHWETGERLPSGDMLIAIEDLTGIPLCVLFCPHLGKCPQVTGGQAPSQVAPCSYCGVPEPVALSGIS